MGEGRVLFRDGRRSGTRESVQAAWRAKKKKEAGSAGYLLGEARGYLWARGGVVCQAQALVARAQQPTGCSLQFGQ